MNMLEPLDDRLRSLMEVERAVPRLAPLVEARLVARIERSLAGSWRPPGGGGPGPWLALVAVAVALGVGALAFSGRQKAAQGSGAVASGPPSTAEPVGGRGRTRERAPFPVAVQGNARLGVKVADVDAAMLPGWFGQRGLQPRSVRATITCGGALCAGADVRLQSPAFFAVAALEPRTIADRHGRAIFAPQRPWIYGLSAAAPGFAARTLAVDLRDPKFADGADVTLELPVCTGHVAGRVLDEAGEPVVDARVTRGLPGFQPGYGVPLPVTGDGRYDVCLSGSDAELRFEAPERGAVVWHIPAQARPGPVAHDEVLMAGATIQGRTAMADGSPVPGVQVSLWPQPPKDPDEERMAGFATAVSDAEGRFRLHGLGSGRFVANAWGPSAVTSEPIWLDVRAPDTTTGIVLTLGGGFEIKGRLVESGRPLAGAKVRLDAERGVTSSFHAVSQSDGTFVLHAVPDEPVHFVVPGYEIVSAPTGDARSIKDAVVVVKT